MAVMVPVSDTCSWPPGWQTAGISLAFGTSFTLAEAYRDDVME